MTITKGTVAEALVPIAEDLVVCPRCEARPGNKCVTISGKKTSVHSSRLQAVVMGYYLGLADAVLLVGQIHMDVEDAVS